jgi:hypothetical protein
LDHFKNVFGYLENNDKNERYGFKGIPDVWKSSAKNIPFSESVIYDVMHCIYSNFIARIFSILTTSQ